MSEMTTMNPKTKKALQGSIRKWERILTGMGTDMGMHNCPLCKLYNRPTGCDGCPVKKKTGRDWCECTPYARYRHLTAQQSHSGGFAVTTDLRSQAMKMLRFLESLVE